MSTLHDTTYGSNKPLYNIGVVARMTGISMATLRAWERRYDFPEAERTAGGHRLYSERDVLNLRWVKERIDEGMQTAQAIHALHHQEQTGNLALVEQLRPPVEIRRQDRPYPIAAHLPLIKDQLADWLMRSDLQEADILLGNALALFSPEDLILEVMSPVLAEIGDAWEQGRINVAVEHLATNYLRQRLLMWMISGPPARETSPILLACAPEEWHEGSLLVMGALLRRRRWPVAYLGQAVPLPDLANITRAIQPALLVLVAMTENAASSLSGWPQWLEEAHQTGEPPLGYGGRVFTLQPEWRERVAGVYLGDTYREGVANIERMLDKF